MGGVNGGGRPQARTEESLGGFSGDVRGMMFSGG